MFNSFGKIYRLTTFGESHGKAIGGIIDGCPAEEEIDIELIQQQLRRRRPGQSPITTQRNEQDTVQILSGLYNGKTTGAPIGFVIENNDQKGKDYSNIEKVYRPSHADYTYHQKYGNYAIEGGGRASARETANWIVAGSIARQILSKKNIAFNAYVSQIGSIRLNKHYSELDLQSTDENPVRCPDKSVAEKMQKLIEQTQKEGDTLGGVITGVIQNVPVGLGEPVFEKLHANLAKAMFSINAVKGFEIGGGFEMAAQKGSETNDSFILENGKITTSTNFSGGIQAGISNGQNIYFSVAFKPVSSVKKTQKTVSKEFEETELTISGRHDPCVVPRAVPIVEALSAMVIFDHYLMAVTRKIK